MKMWAAVVWFCSAVVSSAEAGERWPDGPCADVAALRSSFEKSGRSAVSNANARLGFLLLQRNHCSIDITVEIAADRAARQSEIDATVARGQALRRQQPSRSAPELRQAAEPRQPMNCTTIKIGDDMTSTNCN